MFRLFKKRETKEIDFNFIKHNTGWNVYTLECASSKRIITMDFYTYRNTAFLEPTSIPNRESDNMERHKITLEIYTAPIPTYKGSCYFKFQLTEKSTKKLRKAIDTFKAIAFDAKARDAKKDIGLSEETEPHIHAVYTNHD